MSVLSRGAAWLGRKLLGMSGAADVPEMPANIAALYDRKSRYAMLRSYYHVTGAYDRIRAVIGANRAAVPEGYHKIKSFKNPANRVVEFYAAKLAGDPLLEHISPAEAAPDNLVDLIREVWRFSNLESEVLTLGRMFATDGEIYLQAAVEGSPSEAEDETQRVILHRIDPAYVTDQTLDRRGHLSYLRVDVPRERRDGEEITDYVHTEVWDKRAATHRVWEHDGRQEELSRLAPETLVTDEVLGTSSTDGRDFTGYDFIPVVYRRFRDTGAAFGESCFSHAVEQFDRVNSIATKLDEILFPNAVWALTRETGPQGRDLPPVKLEADAASAPTRREAEAEDARFPGEEVAGYVRVGGEQMVRLPGGAQLASLIPAHNFQAHLNSLQAEVDEIESLLPELTYDRLREGSDTPSGRALDSILDDLRERVKETRRNFEDALTRAQAMALTIGRINQIPEFSTIPEDAYEAGLLEHRFAERNVFPTGELDRAQTAKARIDTYAQAASISLAVLRWQLVQDGVPAEEVERIISESRREERRGSLLDAINGNTL